METSDITHNGTVIFCDGRRIQVKITVGDACAHCAGQAGCKLMNATERVVEAGLERNAPSFSVGEQVLVRMRAGNGFKAVFYAYLLPVIMLMSCVIIMFSLHCDEGATALAAIGAVVLYYLLFYLFRRRINRKFSFKIEKLAE